jgi:hypothetical protein
MIVLWTVVKGGVLAAREREEITFLAEGMEFVIALK